MILYAKEGLNSFELDFDPIILAGVTEINEIYINILIPHRKNLVIYCTVLCHFRCCTPGHILGFFPVLVNIHQRFSLNRLNLKETHSQVVGRSH